MKIGISTASLYMKKETEDAIPAIKSLGADCAEVFLQTFYEYRPEFSKICAGRAEGLEINSVHVNTWHIENGLFSRSRRIRGDAFYWLDQVMRSAQLMGCTRYTFHGKPGYAFHDRAEEVDEAAKYIGAVSEFCARYGVKLCLENVAWCVYSKTGIFSGLKARLPDLCGVLDIKQAERSGISYKEYIEEMKGSISHVHLSDIDEKGNICLPGKGIYNFNEIIKRLKGVGFDGNILIEVYPESYTQLTELTQSLEYLKEIADKV